MYYVAYDGTWDGNFDIGLVSGRSSCEMVLGFILELGLTITVLFLFGLGCWRWMDGRDGWIYIEGEMPRI